MTFLEDSALLLEAKAGSWCNGHDCKINILIYEFWDESGFERTIRVFRLDRRISTLELFLIATTLFTWLGQVAQLSISDVKKLDIEVLNCSTSSSGSKTYYFIKWGSYVQGFYHLRVQKWIRLAGNRTHMNFFVSEGMRVSGCPGPCLLNERGLGGRSYRWIEVILSCKSNQLLFHRQKIFVSPV